MNHHELTELEKSLLEMGYTHLYIIGDEAVGVLDFMYTTAIVVGLDKNQYRGRYCYESRQDAVKALLEWKDTGVGPVGYIKFKGRGLDGNYHA